MQYVRIQNLSRSLVQPITAEYCNTFGCRLRGLMFRRSLDGDRALVMIYPSESRYDTAIHMLFMEFDLGVVWVNQTGVVVDRRLARRWRPAYIPLKPACYVVEMNVERLSDFQIGDKVRFEPLELV